MKAPAVNITRSAVVGTFIALIIAALLALTVLMAHTKRALGSFAGEAAVVATIGTLVWAAKRRVLQLRSGGRNNAGNDR